MDTTAQEIRALFSKAVTHAPHSLTLWNKFAELQPTISQRAGTRVRAIRKLSRDAPSAPLQLLSVSLGLLHDLTSARCREAAVAAVTALLSVPPAEAAQRRARQRGLQHEDDAPLLPVLPRA